MDYLKKNFEHHKNNKYFVNETKRRKSKSIVFNTMFTGMVFILFLTLQVSCSEDNNDSNPPQSEKGMVNGSVKEANGNPYPKTLINLSIGSKNVKATTNSEGNFLTNDIEIGNYNINIQLPLSTKLIGSTPTTVNVQGNQTSTVDFVIEPEPVVAHLNFGTVQVLEEIKDKDGNTPVDPNEPLYAENIFDAPLGLLTAIKAPDGHHVTLSEFKTAKGKLNVHCEGNKAVVNISLDGMIPNGTYTFWLAYLNKIKKVGESIDFANDFVFPTNPPLGSGTKNVLIAGADGTITATIEHSSCILTNQVALVIPILYHINGKTFGSGHVPDSEETAHMLVYFQ